MRVYPDTVEFIDTRRLRVSWSPFSDTTAGYDENLQEYSEQFDDAAWSKSVTVTPNVDEAPDGETTADRITDDDAGSFESIYQSVIIPDDVNWVYTFVYVKKDSDVSRFPEITLHLAGGASAQWVYVQLNTSTGATNTRSSAGTTSVNVTAIGEYWRIELGVKNNAVGNFSARLQIFPAMTTVWGNTEVTAIGSIVVWGAQVSLLALREYMPTLARDGTYTNVRLTTGGLVSDSMSGADADIGGTDYPIVDNGASWLRVLGDASGEGVPTAVVISDPPSAYAMWAFVNGLPVAGCPVDSSDLSMEFNVPGPFFLEMHEEPLGVPVHASQEPHAQRPYLYWYRVLNSTKYLIYADPPLAVEFFMQWEWHVDDLNMFEASAARDLALGGAGWHWLRVEAKTAAGRVSAGDPWPEYVYALPPEPTNASASGTSPNIAIDLTV